MLLLFSPAEYMVRSTVVSRLAPFFLGIHSFLFLYKLKRAEPKCSAR